MTLSSRRLELLTQPEVAAQLAENPLIILPAGSVEQHGPHLPAGTDIFAANVIAERVAEKMDGLVIPGGPLGEIGRAHVRTPVTRGSRMPSSA